MIKISYRDNILINFFLRKRGVFFLKALQLGKTKTLRRKKFASLSL
tara:strand:+ start:1620 stop:1757 length:138 start_codon:yes stop_codon:yes gene_type:complete